MADQTIPSIKNLRGKIGIGTTAPATLLHLNSAVNNGSVLRIESTASDSYPHLSLKNDVREYQVTAHGGLSDAFTIYDGTAGAHRFTISTAGNVGIGCAPTSPFHVTAAAVGQDGTAVTTMTNSICATTIGAKLSFTGGSNTSNNIIGGLSMGNTGEEYAGMYAIDGGSAAATHLSLFTGTNAGINEAIRILSDGNVGIGTTSPDAWLEVSKDNDNSGNQFCVADTEGASAAVRTYTHDGSPSGLILNHYYAQTGSGNEYMRYADFVANIGNGAGTTMRFITKNAANTYSATVIDNDGNLTVTGSLTVSGDLEISGTTTTIDTANLLVEDKNIILGNVTTPSDTTADGGGITLKGASDYTINWTNSTNSWNFNQGLDVTGDKIILTKTNNDAIIECKTTTAGAWFVANSFQSSGYAGLSLEGGGAYNWFVGQYATADFQIVDGSRSSGTPALTIQNTTRNVGIGTTSPDRQLEIYGTNDAYLKLDGGRSGNHGYSLGSDLYGFVVYDDTLSAYRLVIDQDSGNVGIGTSSPAALLDILDSQTQSGSGRATIQTTATTTATSTQSGGMYAIQNYFNLTGTSGSFQNSAHQQVMTTVSSTGTTTYLKNHVSRVHTSGSGQINSVAHYNIHTELGGNGTIANWIGYAVAHPNLTAFENTGHTITNTYGLYIGDITSGTQTNTPYGVYQASTDMLNYFGGNVGIGCSPSTKAHIKDTSAGVGVVLRVENDGASGAAQLELKNDVQSWLVNTRTDDDFSVYNNTSATTPFLIDTSGNVGIGTTTPQHELDVDGTIRHTSTIVSNAHYTAFTIGSDRATDDYGGVNKDYWKLALRTPGSGTTGESSAHAYGDLVWSGVDGVDTTFHERMVLRANGNLGLGVSVPASLLDVRGTVQVGVDGTGHDVFFYGDTAGKYLKWDQSEDTLFFPDNTYITFGGGSDGRIGVSSDNLVIANDTADKDILFQCDDGSGGLAEYFRVDGGVTYTIFSKEIRMLDAIQFQLGSDNDMQLQHNGANGYVQVATGDLIIKNTADDIKLLAEDDIVLRDIDDSTNFLHCINGGAVELFHNGTKKFETTAAGAKVTGNLEVDGITKQKVYTVANLPTPSAGDRAFVSDSSYSFGSSYLGSQVSGGGSNLTPVYSDGSNWYIG